MTSAKLGHWTLPAVLPTVIPMLLLIALAGCANRPQVPPGPAIDTSIDAVGQDSRVLFLILHFTAEDMASSVRILSQGKVSAHYLVSDGSPPKIYRLVDENRRAWHAGESYWKGHTMLNASSIGIEIVNPGPITGPDGRPGYAPYSPAQIDLLLPLVQDIVKRHAISPDRVLGHSDIAPQRRTDPGPQFPWLRLAELGLVRWPDAQRVASERARFERALPDLAWFQAALAKLGFKLPASGQLDAQTQQVLTNFQMKYRPTRHDGEPDAETAAILQVLNQP
jgi:N-acetylmuramoyl-L-alanine amidase